jgi:Protein of unknown function (DUF3592)
VSGIGIAWAPLRGIAAPAGAIFLAAGVALAWTVAESALEYRNALALHGVVTGKERVRADREKNRATRFIARYRLVLPGGEAIETEADLPRKTWEARAVGGEHPVLYLSGKHKVLPPAGPDVIVAGVIMGLIGPVFVLIGWLLLRRPLATVIARLRLLDHGTAVAATVTDVLQSSTAVNRVIQWQLRYRYHAGGATYEGESDLLTPGAAAAWQSGASGSILYDPAKPQLSAWLGLRSAPDAAATAVADRVGSAARTLLRWIARLALFFAALFAAGVLGELFPELKALQAWIADQRMALLFASGGGAVAGVFLLVGSMIAMSMDGGEPMGHPDLEDQQRSMRDGAAPPRLWRASSYRLFGSGAGASAHDEFSLAQLKRAIGSGDAARDPLWRRRLCAAGGALLIFFGLFGALIVISPLPLALLFAAAVLYAVARIAWGFARA